VGAALALFLKKTDTRALTYALGASAGVMVYISFMELMPAASEMLGENSKWGTTLAFFGGMALACLIDRLIPEDENPHEIPDATCLDCVQSTGEFAGNAKLRRSALLFTLAIAIHNFPEGMATFAAGINSLTLGIPIAVAVALHNIPEGITVSVPIYHATGSRKKAFMYSMVSGLAEPIGAGIAMLVLYPFLSATLLSVLFAAVAGTMVFIAFDELLPMAERWGFHHLSIYGIITGMLLMGFTLAVI
jgi:ZIP family zinc transporter